MCSYHWCKTRLHHFGGNSCELSSPSGDRRTRKAHLLCTAPYPGKFDQIQHQIQHSNLWTQLVYNPAGDKLHWMHLCPSHGHTLFPRNPHNELPLVHSYGTHHSPAVNLKKKQLTSQNFNEIWLAG